MQQLDTQAQELAVVSMLRNDVQNQQQALAELRAENAHLREQLTQQQAQQAQQQIEDAARLERLEAAIVYATTRASR